MKVHSYYSKSGKDLIREYINGLPKTEKVDGLTVLNDLENGHIEKLFIKRWRGKIFEVYFKKHNRIFFVSIDSSEIYLLHSCRKQKNKTEKKDENIVIKRAKELGRYLNKKFL